MAFAQPDGGDRPQDGMLSWYREIPVVSRAYLTLSVLTTAACALDFVSPFSLYYNWGLICRGEVWRLATTFLFFGLLSLDFLFHMYFLVRYCRLLEEGEFRGRTADFLVMVGFGVACMLGMAPFLPVHFLGSSLTFMMVYVWGRRNQHVRMSFLGLFPFTAPYLPWVLLAFSVLLGNPAMIDLIGIAVGHTYYFSVFVYPKVAAIRGWSRTTIVGAPRWADRLVRRMQNRDPDAPLVVDVAGDDGDDDDWEQVPADVMAAGEHAHED